MPARREDPALLAGDAEYADDLQVPLADEAVSRAIHEAEGG